MANIAVLGLGAMGGRIASSLLLAGHKVVVWNRSTARVLPLTAAGASAANSPAAAVRNAEFVISMVRDDSASQAVWLDADHGALAAMPRGAIAIDCATLTPAFVQKAAARAAELGLSFLDAPVAGSRPQAEAKQLIFFVGGAEEAYAKAEPVLRQIGSAVNYMGPSGTGAHTKLAVNALFGVQLAAVAELLGFAKRAGLDEKRFVEVIASTPVCSPAAKVAAGGMLAGAFDPMFPIELVSKDFDYVASAAASERASLPVSGAAGVVFAAAQRAGLGDQNITAVARLYTDKS